jgi:hypothetical protein
VGIVFLPAIVVGACVSKERFDAVVAEAQSAQAVLRARAPEEARAAQQAELNRQVKDTESAAQELERRMAVLATTAQRAGGKVERGAALHRQLRRFVDEIRALPPALDERGGARGSP